MNTQDMTKSVNQLEAAFQSFQDNQKARLSILEKKMGTLRPGVSAPEAVLADSAKEGDVKSFAAFLRGKLSTKGLVAGDVPGSVLLPPVLQERVTRALADQFSFRHLARTMTVSSGRVDVILDKDMPDVGWVNETEDRAETKPGDLSKIQIELHELYARPKITQKLLDDAALNAEDWIVDRVAQKMKDMENIAFVNGTGTACPHGFLSYETGDTAALGRLQHVITGESGTLGGDEGANHLFQLVDALPTEYLGGAAWVMSRSALSAIRRLKSGDQPLWQPRLAEGAPETLLGYPVHVLDAMPALKTGTNSSSIAFGNFKEAYQIVEREGLHVLRDPYSAKPYVEFYVSKRVGGDVINFDAIKILKSEN